MKKTNLFLLLLISSSCYIAESYTMNRRATRLARFMRRNKRNMAVVGGAAAVQLMAARIVLYGEGKMPVWRGMPFKSQED